MDEPALDVPACLALIARGDQDAARELVRHTHPLVLKLVRAHRARQLSDEDLVQEVYLTMFARLHRYVPRADIPFTHWLSRLTVNTCRDALRAEGRRPHLSPLSNLSAEASDWLQSLAGEREAPAGEARAAHELVEVLLAQLRPDDRLVLTLLDLEQRPVAEVAALTGWSRPAVKVRAFRARRRLRAIAERRERRER